MSVYSVDITKKYLLYLEAEDEAAAEHDALQILADEGLVPYGVSVDVVQED